jgi:hypothetical protein
MQDERGRYGIVRKQDLNGKSFYVFDLISGQPISPLASGELRIELKKDTKLGEVKRFEAWLNVNIDAIAFTPVTLKLSPTRRRPTSTR